MIMKSNQLESVDGGDLDSGEKLSLFQIRIANCLWVNTRKWRHGPGKYERAIYIIAWEVALEAVDNEESSSLGRTIKPVSSWAWGKKIILAWMDSRGHGIWISE